MNTSELTSPAGLLDPQVLAQLANAAFKALQGQAPSVPASPLATPRPLPSATSSATPQAAAAHAQSRAAAPAVVVPPPVDPTQFGVPGDVELRSLLAPRDPSRVPGASAANPGSVPGSVPGAASSFYFLDHGRPTHGVAGPAVPSDFGSASAARPTPAAAQPGISVPGQRAEPLAGRPLPSGAPFDVERVRRDFPILRERVNGRPLVWLDNAATTQKPRSVIDRVSAFYELENSNIHRAAHELAARATDAYEGAREKVRGFLNARSTHEIVFVRGATEAINLVAASWGRQHIREGDEILISWLEHHANVVPWQQLCAETGARLRVAPVDDTGQIILDEYAKLLGPRTRLVSFTQVSNALGTVTPAKQMVELAHAVGAHVLVDGAQAVSHMAVDVIELNCDWYVFSGHKVFGPTGIGVVYGREQLLNATQPYQLGGNMIQDVTFEKTVYHPAPMRFEAGTGNIADAVGLGAAIDYVTALGMENIAQYEHGLLVYATSRLVTVPGLRLIGTAADKASVLSFTLEGFETTQVGEALNREGIAVRSGHHCAQPILRRFGVEATVRPSLAFYNTCGEVDLLVSVLRRLKSGRVQV